MTEKNNEIGQSVTKVDSSVFNVCNSRVKDIEEALVGKNLFLDSVLISLSGSKFDALNGILMNLGYANLDFAKKVLLYECVNCLLNNNFDLKSKDYSYALGFISSLGLDPFDENKIIQLNNELKYDFYLKNNDIDLIDSPFYGVIHFEEIMNNRAPIEFSYNKCVQNLRKCMSGEKILG